MKFIMNPIVYLLEKLNFKKRFFFISLIMFGVLMQVSWINISTKLEERKFLMSETAPIKYYEPVIYLIQNLNKARTQHILATYDINNKNLENKAEQADKNVDAALETLKNFNHRHWSTNKINQQIAEIDAGWKKIKDSLKNTYSDEDFIRNREVVASLIELLSLVYTEANIHLDSDEISDNLVDIFLNYGPKTAELDSLIGALGLNELLRKQPNPVYHERIKNLIVESENENKELKASLHSLIELDSGMAKHFVSIANLLDKNSAIDIITKDVLQNTSLERSPKEFMDEMDSITNAYYSVSELAYKSFVERNLSRINAIERNIVFTLIGIAVIISIISIVFIGFYKSIAQAIQVLISYANSIAAGDLFQSLELKRSDEFGLVMFALANMQTKLREIVQQIKNTSNTVGRGSTEISQGNLDLSKRTEDQASSLASTAASMEELSVTVKENAEQSKRAAELAEEARKQADSSGMVVNEAVSAMSKINASSKKIAEISSVIDEIAFQTNLLALNAAIEAARAGEQGRGFAVVAQEVRNLAQRSSTAAKEINILITESVDKINSGTDLVNKSGTALQEIVKSSLTVSELISSIAMATNQQSIGLEEINKAITQMDSITQQNAALVEETAATSENVNEQVRNLIKQIEFFKHADSDANHINSTVKQEQPISPKKLSTSNDNAIVHKPIPPVVSSLKRKGTDQEWKEF